MTVGARVLIRCTPLLHTSRTYIINNNNLYINSLNDVINLHIYALVRKAGRLFIYIFKGKSVTLILRK